MIFLGPKLVGEEQIWPRTWRGRRGFVGFRQIRGIPANFFRFRRNHHSWFAGITVKDMLGTKKLLLRAFWEKMPTLRNFETLEGYIVNF
jgi:hypothetical protein